jgi:hypothetical protein
MSLEFRHRGLATDQWVAVHWPRAPHGAYDILIHETHQTAMDRRPEHSEEKLTPTLSIGGKKQAADSPGWTPARQGDGVYRLKDGKLLRKKRSLKIQFEDESGGSRQSSRTVLISGVLTMLALVLVSFWFYMNRAKTRAAAAQQDNPPRVLQTPQTDVVVATAKDWRGELPLETATGFVQAATPEERLRYVRNPDSNAEILADFFENGPGSREKLSALVPIRSIQTDEMAAEEFRADFEEGPSRVVCVVLENDSAKVDFKCYARHGKVDCDKLLDGSAGRADEVRLIVSASDPYYNFAFADDRQWTNFTGQNPDLPVDFLLYARAGSKAETEIRNAVESGPALMTLSLQSRDGSHKHRQFEVTHVMARSWVEPPALKTKSAE